MRFDDALTALGAEVAKRFKDKPPERTTIVRDNIGTLTLVVPNNTLPPAELESWAKELDQKLGAFSPGPRRVLLATADLIDASDVIESRDRTVLPAEFGYVGFVDRLLTNQDWLRRPVVSKPDIPTATFFSIKGGVGRTTAAVAVARQLAAQGKRVLVIDLDLEAPGVGSILTTSPPLYGMVDWCVESLVGSSDPSLLEDMLVSSPLAEGTSGEIQVIPAFGSKTTDYVSKVGRAYMPSLGPTGEERGLADHILSLIKTAAARVVAPDLVLLDARAGLHDIGSAAVTQLGAEVFLFFRPDEQTKQAYRGLFDHLRRSRGIEFGMPDNDLRWKLKMVAAQVEPTSEARQAAIECAYEMWEVLYDEDQGGEALSVDANSFSRNDAAAPHFPICLDFDSRVRSLEFGNPARRPADDYVKSLWGNISDETLGRLFPQTDTAESK